jgi:hypothetical protein
MFQYFVKVVPTRFKYLNGTIFATNQFSVTQYERNVGDKLGQVGLPGTQVVEFIFCSMW